MAKNPFNLFAFAMALSASPTLAADIPPGVDPMAGLYGNTLTCQGPAWSCRYWFNADHTFEATGTSTRDGVTTPNKSHGTWAIENGKVCRHPDPAPENPSPCTDWEFFKKVGDKWEHTSSRGTEYFTILPGHQ